MSPSISVIDLSPCPDPYINVGSVFEGQVNSPTL